MSESSVFESWAILNLMGHSCVAGLVTEVTIAGKGLLRVDVPETTTQAAFTRFVSPDSLYDLTPTTEMVARARAETLRTQTISRWDLPEELQAQIRAGQKLLTACADAGRPICPQCGHDPCRCEYSPELDEMADDYHE